MLYLFWVQFPPLQARNFLDDPTSKHALYVLYLSVQITGYFAEWITNRLNLYVKLIVNLVDYTKNSFPFMDGNNSPV